MSKVQLTSEMEKDFSPWEPFCIFAYAWGHHVPDKALQVCGKRLGFLVCGILRKHIARRIAHLNIPLGLNDVIGKAPAVPRPFSQPSSR